MQIVRDMARYRLTPLEQSITEVAALLHDIGKLRSVGSGRIRPVHCALVRHETQTNRLLEPHLSWLRNQAPVIASGLEYELDFLSQSRQQRGFADFVGAELIVNADQVSTALANKKRLNRLLCKTIPADLDQDANLQATTVSRAQNDD